MAGLDDFRQFDFTFDPTLDPFGATGEPMDMDDVPGADPGVFLPNTEGRTEFLPPDPDRVPVIEHAVKQDTPEYAARPASERIAELLGQMAPQRRVLLGIVRAAKTALPMSEVANVVAELTAHKFSVYSPSNFCTMLEAAGALLRVDAEGAPYSEHKPAPKVVIVDGQEFYEPGELPEIWWVATEAGNAAVADDDPVGKLERQLAGEEHLKPLYKRVLSLAAGDRPITMSELSAKVDSDPLIAEPRRFFVQHFVEVLERCEALRWQGEGWQTTETGAQVLSETLADVVDEGLPCGAGAADRLPTETDGINW